MIRILCAATLGLALTACDKPLDGGLGGPKMADAIPNGVEVTAAPIAYFHQGVKGAQTREASLSAATFTFSCDPDRDGSLLARANASAQYSSIAQEKVLFWLVNSRVLGQLKREVHEKSVPNHGCAVTDLTLTRTSTDPVTVMKFVSDNRLLGKITAMR